MIRMADSEALFNASLFGRPFATVDILDSTFMVPPGPSFSNA